MGDEKKNCEFNSKLSTVGGGDVVTNSEPHVEFEAPLPPNSSPVPERDFLDIGENLDSEKIEEYSMTPPVHENIPLLSTPSQQTMISLRRQRDSHLHSSYK